MASLAPSPESLDHFASPKALDASPAVAVGCMNFGGRTNEAESVRIVERALERGVTFFDTANAYTNGDSERILGRALGSRRGACQIASKVGARRVSNGNEGLAPARILAAIDESLERLGTDHLDIYYLHVPDHATPIEETLAAMNEVLQSGKARAWGVSNYAGWQVLEMIHWADTHSMARPKLAQHMYNMLIRQLDIEWFRFAAKYRLHTTVYNPLAGGLLSGKYSARDVPGNAEKGTRFDGNALYQRRYWTETMFQTVRALEAIATEEKLTLVQMSYAFCATRPGVDSVLLGPGSVEHLDAGIDDCRRTLSDGAMKKVDHVYRRMQGTDASYAR